MKLRNVSPLGRVEIVSPPVGVVEAGAEFEVDAAWAKQLLAQPANFAPAADENPDKDPRTTLELRRQLDAMGIAHGEDTTKAALVALIHGKDER